MTSIYPFTLTRRYEDIRVGIRTIGEKEAAVSLKYPWDIVKQNENELKKDFAAITKGRKSQGIPKSVQAISPENIFIEEGARIQYCILNASRGPIYIGKNAEVMEGALIRGPFALCEGAVVKMGAKIYGATTVGPYSVAGGEISNSVIFGYSNKAHDGYLGDSVIGEWCNLGAGTTNSNLQNSAKEIQMWDDVSQSYVYAGLKCGLFMGDYSRTAINTSFNTGTVVGVCANVFGEGLLPKYIPDFSWGCKDEKYILNKALQDIENWKRLKKHSLSDAERETLKRIFKNQL